MKTEKGLFSLQVCSSLLGGDHVGIDLSNAWKAGARIVNIAISLLPNILLAVLIFAIFLALASMAKSMVRRVSHRRQRRLSLGILLGQLAQTAVAVLGFLIAFSVVAPSFHASDLVKMLGIGSVAIGFAFQNILQNFLAGILLLLHEPFRIGDFISVNGMEGRVDDIQTRATVISTPDGHRVIMPNAVLFTSPVVVRDPNAPKIEGPKEEREAEVARR
jgi:small conductance mechanosensitive channel